MADGELIVLRRGVYADAAAFAESSPAKQHAFYVTAVMLHTVGTASHVSAALLHGLDLFGKNPGNLVTLTRPRGAKGSRSNRNKVQIHAAGLPPDHVTMLYGRPITSAARTVIDIARTLTFMHGGSHGRLGIAQEENYKGGASSHPRTLPRLARCG